MTYRETISMTLSHLQGHIMHSASTNRGQGFQINLPLRTGHVIRRSGSKRIVNGGLWQTS